MMKTSSMRPWISLAEGKPLKAAKPLPPAKPDLRAQAQALYDKAMTVAQQLGDASPGHLRRGWDQAWVKLFNQMLQKAQAEHAAAQREAAAFAAEDGDPFTATPFDLPAALPDLLATLWDHVETSVQIGSDARHELRAYSKAHPTTESSDTISLLQDEQRIGGQIDRAGGLGSLASMDKTLDALSELADAIKRYFDVDDRFRDCTEAAQTLVHNGLPLILVVSKRLGAVKPTP